MAKKLNLKFAFTMLVALIGTLGMSSCKKDLLQPGGLNQGQLVAGRIYGTWANPRDIVTPKNVPAEVFGAMRLVFTTDEAGNPSKFMAQDCPVVFGNTTGTWGISGDENKAKVTLISVEPVNDFDVKISSTSLTLSFFMGWENTDTKETGKGNFSVTLTRQ